MCKYRCTAGLQFDQIGFNQTTTWVSFLCYKDTQSTAVKLRLVSVLCVDLLSRLSFSYMKLVSDCGEDIRLHYLNYFVSVSGIHNLRRQ